jgi:hypothetical protein
VTDTKSQEFSQNAGIKITSFLGVSAGVINAGGSYELNYQFTYTSNSSRELLKCETVTRNLRTPAGRAAALWARHFAFRAVRADNQISVFIPLG